MSSLHPSSLESPPPAKLTPKQRVFVASYIGVSRFNATKAALAAGYSEKTAYSIGSENLKKPEIKAAIDAYLAENTMGAPETLFRLTEQARGDLGDFLTDKGGLDWETAHTMGKTRLVKQVKRKTIRTTSKDGSIDTETTIEEIELYSAQAALHLIGKHLGLFVDRTEHTGKDGGPIAFTWQDEAVLLIKSGDITYEAALETFDHDDRLVRDLFAKAQVPVSTGQSQED